MDGFQLFGPMEKKTESLKKLGFGGARGSRGLVFK